MVVFYRVVDDDGEEYGGTADNRIYKSIGGLAEPGFLIEVPIGAHQGIEGEPAEGDGGGPEPESLGEDQPVVVENSFCEQDPPAEMENNRRQERCCIIAKDIPQDRDGMELSLHARIRY